MNKIKWIISDLDGTLLIQNHKSKKNDIHKKTISNINKAIDEKIHFSIATGRHYYDALKITKDVINFPKESFIIGLNGGQIFSLDKNELIFEDFINKNLVNEIDTIIKTFNKLYEDALFFVYSSNRKIFFIKNSHKDFEHFYKKAINFEKNIDVFEYKIIDSIFEIDQIYKICISFNKEIEDPWKIVDELKAISQNLDYIPSGDVYIEIINKGVSKGKAIDFINDNYYHLSKKEILTFGDSGNDLDMFDRSEISITRTCAPKYVLEKTTNHYSGGASVFIKKAIKDLILNKK